MATVANGCRCIIFAFYRSPPFFHQQQRQAVLQPSASRNRDMRENLSLTNRTHSATGISGWNLDFNPLSSTVKRKRFKSEFIALKYLFHFPCSLLALTAATTALLSRKSGSTACNPYFQFGNCFRSRVFALALYFPFIVWRNYFKFIELGSAGRHPP